MIAAGRRRGHEGGGGYVVDGQTLDTAGMVERLLDWLRRYPTAAVEDGLAEDWEAWTSFRVAAAGAALVVCDDLTCTDPSQIRRPLGARAADTLLLKPNQVRTLTEAAEARTLARNAGWRLIASARAPARPRTTGSPTSPSAGRRP
jgi:enolase